MLSREKINELASEAIEAVSVKVPDNTRWWIPEHYDQEFARLIIQEVEKHRSCLSPQGDNLKE